jgi:hypothetical protein
MLETLRTYGAGLLAAAGEEDAAAATLAGWALGVAEQAAAGLVTRTGEQDAARWLDAEDATLRQVLAWAMGRDREAALRLAGALGFWWVLRGRLPGVYPLLAELAGYAEPGSDRWCTAQIWAGWAAWYSFDLAGVLRYFTALRDAVADRLPSRALAEALNGRSRALLELGQVPEAAEDARRSLAVARELGYPWGEVMALGLLASPPRRSATWGRRCGWPGRPIRSPATSLPRWPGGSAWRWPRCWSRPATSPPPSRPARPRWPRAGTRAT